MGRKNRDGDTGDFCAHAAVVAACGFKRRINCDAFGDDGQKDVLVEVASFDDEGGLAEEGFKAIMARKAATPSALGNGRAAMVGSASG